VPVYNLAITGKQEGLSQAGESAVLKMLNYVLHTKTGSLNRFVELEKVEPRDSVPRRGSDRRGLTAA